ncbi:DUF1800 family protein [Algisphaera agarilytica]|uniref:Uncharacterized protein (DUF1800 family)/chitodextrinase n=1 Tax=Algisphaera agarilytica TaxID=1385975 RepID=A0A7X0H810_9BACT|nr:DUF1800 family protein [Algisphaera agarilytica]MBB6429520.1 uncharacterized protein (DUF1800 family)/chitodextrinase [Algisphaera agarilytica]
MPLSRRYFAWLSVLLICVSLPAIAAPPVNTSTRSELRHLASNGSSIYRAIDMPLSGPRAIEPRMHRDGETVVIFVFDQALQSVGNIATSHGTINSAISGVRTQFPDTIAVHLNGVPDAEWVTVSLTDIVSQGGETLPSAAGTVGYLLGDVTFNRVVNVSDIRKVATFSGQDPSVGGNFVQDLTINNAINVSDIRFAASRNGRSLPNTAPTIVGLTNQSTVINTPTAALSFVVDDFATPADSLAVTAVSDNPGVVTDANIVVTGSGSNRSVVVTPEPGEVGSAIITLTVSDGSMSSTASYIVSVTEEASNQPPQALAYVKNFLGPAPLTVELDGTRSFDPDDGILSYAWDFGDGAGFPGSKLTHTYTQPGTYTAKLTVDDFTGDTDEIEYVITVSDGTFNVNATPSANDASRFLWQAAFGPSEGDVADVQALGYEGWIDQQMALSPTLLTQQMFDQAATRNGAGQVFQQRFAFANLAVDAQDQLRQRVAWALIQIFVMNNDQDSAGPSASRGYYNFMLENAFGNYRDLLSDVTFSYPMGNYLTYRDNRKADPAAGTVPDENYAREIKQLFSIGLFELNLDGTQKKDAQGNPIPTYTNEDIVQFARVFTGLRTSNIGSNFEQRTANPMRMQSSWHEFGDKQLLNYPGAVNGGYIPARGSGQQTDANGIADVNFAIDNVFNHPNTPPFISHLLIQRLVTSNPTPAYVERVASVFVDDGTGTRGNLGAVVKAILLDPEARDRTYSSSPYFGKIIEPFLLKWSLYRVLDRYDRPGQPFGLRVDELQFGETDKFGQAYMTSPSVFNFYLPDYTVANSELDRRTLDIPELQITNEITVFSSLNDHRRNSIAESGDDEANVYDDLRALIPSNNVTNNTALIEAIDDLLMYGTMSPEMKQILLTVAPRVANQTERVRAMVYMVVSSPEFQLVN